MPVPNLCSNIRYRKTQNLPELNSVHYPVALAENFEELRTQNNKRPRTIFPCNNQQKPLLKQNSVSNSSPASTSFLPNTGKAEVDHLFAEEGPHKTRKLFCHMDWKRSRKIIPFLGKDEWSTRETKSCCYPCFQQPSSSSLHLQ